MNGARSLRIQSREDEEASLLIGRNCVDCARMTNVHDPSMRLEVRLSYGILSNNVSILFVECNPPIPCPGGELELNMLAALHSRNKSTLGLGKRLRVRVGGVRLVAEDVGLGMRDENQH